MGINPLDAPNSPLKFEARNFDVRGSTTKNGPTYKVVMEVDKEVFDCFITAKLERAVFGVAVVRIDYDNPVEDAEPPPQAKEERPAPEKKKRRMNPTEIRAIELCRDGNFHKYLHSLGMAWLTKYSNEDVARSYILEKCGIEHRWQIEKSKDAAIAFGGVIENFELWKKGAAR